MLFRHHSTAARRTRRLTGLLASAAVMLAASSVGIHGAGAVPAPWLQLSPTSGPSGTTTVAKGTGFAPLASGVLTFRSAAVATFSTDRKGAFTSSFSVPGGSGAGAATVQATTGTLNASATFTVTTTATTAVTTTVPATTTSTVATTTTTTTTPTGGASVALGVSTPSGPYNLAELDAFERDAGKRAGVLMYFQGWAYDEFDASAVGAIAARGTVPEITWEPWDYRLGTNQPTYALRQIAGGAHDAYITRWAQGAKAYGGHLLVRFAHEMNDRQYPWSEQSNGNQPGDYVAAWRHVVDVFRAVGATNVSWVWSPNVSYAGTTPLAGLYPGDTYVDWVAADGYNGGTALPWGGWQTFSQIFGPTLTEIAAITGTKPVMIAETASVEAGGSKATWINDFFAQLKLRPEIKAFVWFNHNKEADWRIESSEAARAAFAAGAADPLYGAPAV